MNKTHTQYRPFSVSMPTEIVKKIDLLAKKQYRSRSDIVREALLSYTLPRYTPTKAEKKAIQEGLRDTEKGNIVSLSNLKNELGIDNR